MLRAKTALESPDARAERLLVKDIHDRGVRVEMIELAVNGYRALGWEEHAVALGWFAAVGRAQEAGGPTSVPPVPELANRRRGSIMDHMVELILGASAIHHIREREATKQALTQQIEALEAERDR